MAATTATTLKTFTLGAKFELRKTTRSFGAASPKAVRSVTVCAQKEETSRRSMLALLAATVATGSLVSEAKADAIRIKLEGPPPPIGGLPGTDSSDQARDTDAPLKERFYLQSLEPAEALERAKEAAARIVAVKTFIDKKAWTSVRNDLRTKANYLRFDLATVINSKPKAERKSLEALNNKLSDSIEALDYAARAKNPESASKNYDATISALDDILAKLG